MKAPFKFLEWWGMKATFWIGGVMKALFKLLEWWGIVDPLTFLGGWGIVDPIGFLGRGVLSTPLDFWVGGVLSTPLAFWLRVGYFPLNALQRLLCLGRQSWCGGGFTSPTPDQTPCLWPGLGGFC